MTVVSYRSRSTEDFTEVLSAAEVEIEERNSRCHVVQSLGVSALNR